MSKSFKVLKGSLSKEAQIKVQKEVKDMEDKMGIERWQYGTCERKDRYVVSKKIDSFLEEVTEVCRKHGFCIEPIDHGSFSINLLRGEENLQWLNTADIDESLDDKDL